ncbi:hypothetical protein [Agreia pratensis]|nr:hypothetical protein [Agreia pratensis]
MSVAEREFTFDSLLAEFGDDERTARVEGGVASPTSAVAAPAVVTAVAAAAAPVLGVHTPSRRRVADAAAVRPAPAKRPAAKKSDFARRALAMPSADVLQLGGLVVIAGISLTLAFVALSR